MTIDRNTRLLDILAAYPEIREKLPTVNERFHMINTPIAKVILKTATIADMSQRSGMEESILIAKINELIRAPG